VWEAFQGLAQGQSAWSGRRLTRIWYN
jgi:hypothetical protein